MIYAEEYVDKYHRMIPKVEDLLFDGTKLRDGMVVVVAEQSYRMEITDSLRGESLHLALLMNRWARISDVTLEFVGNESVVFVATYDDGHKEKRRHPMDWAWLVKVDSISDEAPVPRALADSDHFKQLGDRVN